MKQKLEEERIKYVETNKVGIPLENPDGDGADLITDISEVENASLVVPLGVVVVTMDGTNIGDGGKSPNNRYLSAIRDKYRPFFLKVIEVPHYEKLSLFFKVPKGMTMLYGKKEITLCGYIVDINTSGSLINVKKDGILKTMESELTNERLDNLPELPMELYPLKDEPLAIEIYRGFDLNAFNYLVLLEHIARILNNEYDFNILQYAILYLNNLLSKPLNQLNIMTLIYNYDGLNAMKSIITEGKEIMKKIESDDTPWYI